jgi:tRNA uridine 5-carboxymethylaminomethyl modification enzyme
VDDLRWEHFSRKRDLVSRETQRLRSVWVHPGVLSADHATALLGKPLEHEHSLLDLLRRGAGVLAHPCGLLDAVGALCFGVGHAALALISSNTVTCAARANH